MTFVPSLTARYGKGTDSDATDTLIASTLKSQGGRGWSHDAEATYVAAPLSHGSNPNSNMAGRRREDDFNLVADTVRSHPRPGSNSDGNLVSFTSRGREGGAQTECQTDGVYPALRSGRGGGRRDSGIASPATGVRRLTPRECERLQALPDDWTAHGPDSRRYAALGDAVTSSVAHWIGTRILARVGAQEPAA